MADQCLQCGAALKGTAKFCPRCGTRVSVQSSPGEGWEVPPPSKGASKEAVFAKVKSLRRSLGKGAVFGAEVLGKISSLRKGIGGLMHFALDVRAEDRRSTLEADGEDMLWIFAEVISDDSEVTKDRITRGMRFWVEGTHADWVTLGRPQLKDGMKAVRVKAEPPDRNAELIDEKVTVVASATFDGTTVVGTVSLRLEEEVRMKIRILE